MTCMYCNFEMCFQCNSPAEDDTCCCKGKGYIEPSLNLSVEKVEASTEKPEFPLWTPPAKDLKPEQEKRPIGQPPKEGKDMKAVESTGRKRAVKAAPITEGMLCEWSGLKFAGGGVKPIIGCIGKLAVAVHHGPDKSVLNNFLGVNLHRICTTCHNRWHASNDEFYGEGAEDRPESGEPWLPLEGHTAKMHDKYTKASTEEQMNNEIFWSIRKDRRKQDLTEGIASDILNTDNETVVNKTSEIDLDDPFGDIFNGEQSKSFGSSELPGL